MTMLFILAVLFLVIAIFLAFGVRASDVTALIQSWQSKGKQSMKQVVQGKQNRLLTFLQTSQQMMAVTGQGNRFSFMILLSVCLMGCGIATAIAVANYYLIPVAMVAFGVIPFVYIRFQYIEYNKFVLERLSTAMAQVTTSYERSENILLAFKENVEDTAEPIKSIFVAFVHEIESVNPNYEQAIDQMKGKLNNSVFAEWCDALKRCSRNRTLKYVLSPIVTKLSKMQVVTGELQTILLNVTKNFWVLLSAALALLFVGVYVLPDGLMIDIPTNLRNLLVAVNLAVCVGAGIKVALVTHDIQFEG